MYMTTANSIACELRNYGLAPLADVSLHIRGDYFRGNTLGPNTKIVTKDIETTPVGLAANGGSVQTYIFKNPTCFSLAFHPAGSAKVTLVGDSRRVDVPIYLNQITAEFDLFMTHGKVPNDVCMGM